MAWLPDLSALLGILSRLKATVASDVSDVQVVSVGGQSQVSRRNDVEWGSVTLPTDIVSVAFQFTNMGEAGVHLQSVFTGDPDADFHFTRCLTELDNGEEWVIPPRGEAVVWSFDIGFNPRLRATEGRTGEYIDVEFHFRFQDQVQPGYERSITEPVYITPLSELDTA